MVTKVSQSYTASLNVSVTHKDGVLTKVTLWRSGDDAKKTQRIESEQA